MNTDDILQRLLDAADWVEADNQMDIAEILREAALHIQGLRYQIEVQGEQYQEQAEVA